MESSYSDQRGAALVVQSPHDEEPETDKSIDVDYAALDPEPEDVEAYEDDESVHAEDESIGWGPDGPDMEKLQEDEEGTRGLRDKFKKLMKMNKKPQTGTTDSSAGGNADQTGVLEGGFPGVTPGAVPVDPTKPDGGLADSNIRHRPAPNQGSPIPNIIGPCLRFGGYDPVSHLYSASVLIVKKDSYSHEQPPYMTFWDPFVDIQETHTEAMKLDTFGGFSFWRFNIVIMLAENERTVEYHVSCMSEQSFTFTVPGINQKWLWGFYSCNGFHDPKIELKFGGIQPLWHDVLRQHMLNKPMHVMVGGGDQLYNDNVWELSSLSKWVAIKKEAERLKHPWTDEMNQALSWCYFNNYMRHWSQDQFSQALTAVPQVMMWDDHDIFDGWGSYPAELQACPVFQGVMKWATKFYLLFQQHSTEERVVADNEVFGERGWNWLGHFGSNTAVLMLDTRAERCRQQIITKPSWEMIERKLWALPRSTRHLVVVATVPVIYPKVKVLDATVHYLAGAGSMPKMIQKFLQKSGLAGSFYSQFGEPEIWDDLLDHWSADVHHEEKLHMLTMLQSLARNRNIRVTFLSGDVHVAAAARFQSHPPQQVSTDHRYMLQVISSAIGNEPPPSMVVKVLNASAKSYKVNNETKEKPLELFHGKKKMIKGARNWCIVSESDPGPQSSLNFEIRVEGMSKNQGKVHVYSLAAPPLGLPLGLQHVAESAPISSVGASLAEVPASSATSQPGFYPGVGAIAADQGIFGMPPSASHHSPAGPNPPIASCSTGSPCWPTMGDLPPATGPFQYPQAHPGGQGLPPQHPPSAANHYPSPGGVEAGAVQGWLGAPGPGAVGPSNTGGGYPPNLQATSESASYGGSYPSPLSAPNSAQLSPQPVYNHQSSYMGLSAASAAGAYAGQDPPQGQFQPPVYNHQSSYTGLSAAPAAGIYASEDPAQGQNMWPSMQATFPGGFPSVAGQPPFQAGAGQPAYPAGAGQPPFQAGAGQPPFQAGAYPPPGQPPQGYGGAPSMSGYPQLQPGYPQQQPPTQGGYPPYPTSGGL